jgi:F-type H+-transporting ATPase subunit gamma
MSSLESLKKQLQTAEDLRSVVKTMKALAAVSIQQYEKATRSLKVYQRTLDMAMQVLLQNLSAEEKLQFHKLTNPAADRLGLIVFGSDHGLCGQFNQQIAARVADHLHRLPRGMPWQIAAVGARPIPLLAGRDIAIANYRPVPSSVHDITATVQDLLQLVEQWQRQDQVTQVQLLYNRTVPGGGYQSQIQSLLPIDPDWLSRLERPWLGPTLPTFAMDAQELFSALVRQFLFIMLFQAQAASLTSENASRLAAMQSAESNINERLDGLQADYRRQRQASITEELLDVVAGFEALQD